MDCLRRDQIFSGDMMEKTKLIKDTPRKIAPIDPIRDQRIAVSGLPAVISNVSPRDHTVIVTAIYK